MLSASKGDPGDAVPFTQWNSSTAYEIGNKITYNGSSYYCVAGNTNQSPPNATYWLLIAAKGDNTTATAVSTSDASNVQAKLDAHASQLADIETIMSKYEQLNITVQNGYYAIYDTSFHANESYRAYKGNCNPGDKFKVDKVIVSAPSVATVIFYNEDGTINSHGTVGTGSDVTFNNFEFTAPSGAYSYSITSHTTTAFKIFQFLRLDVVKMASAMGYQDIRAAMQIGYYTNFDTPFHPNVSYRCCKVACNSGEKYKVSRIILSTPSVSLAVFYNADGTIHSHVTAGSGTDVTYNDYEFTVPDGVCSFSITSHTEATFTVYKHTVNGFSDLTQAANRGLYVRYIGTKVEIMFKYSATLDMIIVFDKVGANTLMQIAGIYTIANTGKYCCGDFSKTRTTIRNASSDWLGPYKVQADNDADGDGAGAGSYYTGGFHAYDNTQTGVPTARTLSVVAYADKDVISNGYGGNCESVRIVVTNRIQGNNTTKADGTGREILQETVTYTVTPGKIDVVNRIKALEAVTIKEYYGLQINNGMYYDKCIFFGSKVVECDYTQNNTYTGDIDKIVAYNDTGDYIMAFHKKLGLGKRPYVTAGQITARNGTWYKTYFNLVAGTTISLAANEEVFLEGCYTFANGTIKME